jgi:hypothetical protein
MVPSFIYTSSSKLTWVVMRTTMRLLLGKFTHSWSIEYRLNFRFRVWNGLFIEGWFYHLCFQIRVRMHTSYSTLSTKIAAVPSASRFEKQADLFYIHSWRIIAVSKLRNKRFKVHKRRVIRQVNKWFVVRASLYLTVPDGWQRRSKSSWWATDVAKGVVKLYSEQEWETGESIQMPAAGYGLLWIFWAEVGAKYRLAITIEFWKY